MRFLVNCPFGLSSILGNELKYLGLAPHHSFETGVYVNGEQADMMKINLWSRVANKVYLQVAFGPCFDFDALFALMQSVNRDNYITPGQNIVVTVHTKGSKLESARTIQSISNKAIYKQLSPNGTWPMDPKIEAVDIFIMIIDNQASIFLNTSGAPLHQRGYRSQTGDAPLKENLAAALVILSTWKYGNPFWDPFCGSGTLGIEAAMIAKNIAPGLRRHFAFEQWKDIDIELYKEIRIETKSKKFSDKTYQIFCSDVDEKMLAIAATNAENAGVANTIQFFHHDFLNTEAPTQIPAMTIVSNPPYGKRLMTSDLEQIYTQLITIIQNNLGGGFITSYNGTKDHIDTKRRRKRMFNGADEVIFYFK